MQGRSKKPNLRDYFVTTFLLVLFSGMLGVHREAAPSLHHSVVTINGTAFGVELARTEDERTKGLSGRQALLADEGMLFFFDHPERYGFWMPDMHFAIDIIWIGPDWHIVGISEDVKPDSYPNVFMPERSAQYVLEVSAGSAERHGWKVGDPVLVGKL